MGRPAAGISRDAREWLLAYAWPGNVRELRNAIERAILLCDGGLITREHLPAAVGRPAPAAPGAQRIIGSRRRHSSSRRCQPRSTGKELRREGARTVEGKQVEGGPASGSDPRPALLAPREVRTLTWTWGPRRSIRVVVHDLEPRLSELLRHPHLLPVSSRCSERPQGDHERTGFHIDHHQAAIGGQRARMG